MKNPPKIVIPLNVKDQSKKVRVPPAIIAPLTKWNGKKKMKDTFFNWTPEGIPLRNLIKEANDLRLNAEEKLYFHYKGIKPDVTAKSNYDKAWAIFNALTELQELKKSQENG